MWQQFQGIKQRLIGPFGVLGQHLNIADAEHFK
jgi:hypothetical protein